MQQNFSSIQPNQGIMSSSRKVLKKLMESMMLKSLKLLRSVKLAHLHVLKPWTWLINQFRVNMAMLWIASFSIESVTLFFIAATIQPFKFNILYLERKIRAEVDPKNFPEKINRLFKKK